MNASRTPSYQRIADDLAARVASGEFAPGARLPTEAEMMSAYGASSTTVRAAIRILGTLGLAETRQGSGSYVVERRLLRFDAATEDAWAAAVRATGTTWSEELTCQIVPAASRYASLFRVEQDVPLLLRRTLRRIGDLPALIEAAYYPAQLMSIIPALAMPASSSATVSASLAEHGHPLACHTDELSARPPSRVEADLLHLPTGGFLLVQLRVSRDEPNGPVIQIVETAYRSDLHELVYDLPRDS